MLMIVFEENVFPPHSQPEKFALGTNGGEHGEFLKPDEVKRFFFLEFERLTGYITGVSHSYIRAALPRLRDLLFCLSGTQTFQTTCLRFSEIATKWILILDFESKVVFPYIVELEKYHKKTRIHPARSEKLYKDICWIQQSNLEYKKMVNVLHISLQSSFAEDSSEIVREINMVLEKLHRHISQLLFIEDCILFPRILRLERELSEID